MHLFAFCGHICSVYFFLCIIIIIMNNNNDDDDDDINNDRNMMMDFYCRDFSTYFSHSDDIGRGGTQ